MLFDLNSNPFIETLATGLFAKQELDRFESLSSMGVELNSVLQIERDGSQVKVWREQVETALNWIQTNTPVFSKRMNTLVREIAPLRTPTNCPLGRGLSSIHRFGTIFLGLPRSGNPLNDRAQLILNLAHETGHQALILLQASDALVLDPKEMVYSPIRKVNRPIIRALHGNAALSSMILLVDELVNSQNIDSHLKQILIERRPELERDLHLGLTALRTSSLSQLGLAVCRQFTDQLKSSAA